MVSTVEKASTATCPTNTGQASGAMRFALPMTRFEPAHAARLVGAALGGIGIAVESATAVPSMVMRRQVARFSPGLITVQCCTSSKLRPQPFADVVAWLVEQIAMQGVSGVLRYQASQASRARPSEQVFVELQVVLPPSCRRPRRAPAPRRKR